MPRRKKPAALALDTIVEALAAPLPRLDETPIAPAVVQVPVLANVPNRNSFPVIGIGASAGGLAAIEIFFRAMPPDSGMAFVIVQHLDPTHESLLVEIVRRFTKMAVHQVKNRMAVEPNCIYIIPPNREMTISDNHLLLTAPPERRGFRLPIDAFFSSLAHIRGEQAIGIVLSGTGSDGTLGLKAIRDVGGLTIAQDPETAQYNGMPSSAIDGGAVDYILPLNKMPAQLSRFVQHYVAPHDNSPVFVSISEESAVEEIFVLLRRQTKHDFSGYKRDTIIRRIQRRMVIKKIESYRDYVAFIQQETDEIQNLFQSLLIGVTSFFRDTAVFEVLERDVIAHLGESSQSHRPFRIWVAGCSTGEEAYSIAILLHEHISKQGWNFDVQIFATDIDEHSIARASLGMYPDSIADTVSPERLHRFFVKDGSNYRVIPPIREMLVFAVQSVTKDPPFSRMNLISCRNLLIYLNPDLQKRVIALFHYGLVHDGFLLLGPSESLGLLADYFHTVDRRAKLFQKTTAKSILQEPATNFSQFSPSEIVSMPPIKKTDKPVDIRELAEKSLLQEFTPPCVIVNEQSEALYFHGKLAGYFAPSSGDASLNIVRLVREDLRVPISAALRKVFEHKDEVIHEQIAPHDQSNGHGLTLTIKSLPGHLWFMVVFEEIAQSSGKIKTVDGDDNVSEQALAVRYIEDQLQSTRNYLQATIEELENSNQKLKSTNEGSQAANEELQSTNEELETSKEELQSVNEELVTLNSELQSSLDTLGRTTNDLNNLLINLDVAIVFLDIHLNIQRFNASATHLINLIHTDIGRPISHIVSNLAYDGLLRDAQSVLDTLIPVDKAIADKRNAQ
jgi:two-component system CheB/CheR fusion protein